YKIELCFAYSKDPADATTISFRDVFVKYNFNKNHHIQAGNVFMPFGMKPLGLAYKFIDDATVDNAFCLARKMGIQYLLTTDRFNFTGGVFSDGNIDKGNDQFDKGINFAAKAIVRPVINETSVLHFGFAPMYCNTPVAGSSTFKAVVPQTFTTEGKTLYKNAFDCDHYSRYEAEMIFIQKRFLLEMHYQGASYEKRESSDRYHVGGFLAQTSFLLIGEQQNYNKVTGLCQNASPRNLELLARYDYLDLHDGGNQNDLTIGLNYFFSKHFNMKLNYGVTQENHGDAHKTYNTLQLRGQFSF
nr:OprO/OprP family phosphate-selective porin [Bacteroidales bacterium]